MNMDVEVITSLIGIVGLALAAIFSSLGYLYRGWTESKRSARKLLYLLLEIRYALSAALFDSSSTTKEYINHYTNRLKEKGYEVDKEHVYSQIGTVVEKHFSNVAKTSKTDIEERLLQPFEEALSNLSQLYPVLAYRLRGKEKLELLAKLNASYLNSLESTFISKINEEWAKQAILEFAQEVKIDTLQGIAKNIDEEIFLLSKYCGWVEHYRCKKVLSMKFGEFDSRDFLELDDIIDKLILIFTEAASNAALQPADS